MKWILLFFMFQWGAVSAEFDSEETCNKVLGALTQRFDKGLSGGVCVPQGTQEQMSPALPTLPELPPEFFEDTPKT